MTRPKEWTARPWSASEDAEILALRSPAMGERRYRDQPTEVQEWCKRNRRTWAAVKSRLAVLHARDLLPTEPLKPHRKRRWGAAEELELLDMRAGVELANGKSEIRDFADRHGRGYRSCLARRVRLKKQGHKPA